MFGKEIFREKGLQWTVFLLAVACIAACSPQKVAVKTQAKAVPNVLTADADMRARLEKMAAGLEEQRIQNHVPGMALAVVRGDELIFARGFGMADLERGTPVHPGTSFAIGSATKAFTSTLVGMMVEEGRMLWDDPIEKHLPYMKMKLDSDNESDTMTLRDMLSHRSGFTRMGILWVGGENSRETVLKTATQAKPWDGYRKGFHYNNIMYLGAGVAAGKAAGSNWDQLLAERLFKPLGMNASHSTYAAAQRDPLFSTGYRWDTEKEEIIVTPMRSIDSAAPAGSINANVLDMAQWLRFQLGKGVFEGKRLISEEILMATRQPQMAMGGGTAYGMGWMLQEANGEKLVFHGGNIDGFASMVALAPEKNLGFVLLTNTSSNPLQNSSVSYIFDQLLSKEKLAAGAKDESAITQNFKPYLGEYMADFGPFQNAALKVLEQNGTLAVDVPGQTIYELKPENEEGKWYFTLTNTIAVSFEKDADGAINMMRLHQDGFDFELPRKGITIEPEIDEAELRKYLGTYYSEDNKRNLDVVLKNHRLGIVINERLTVELHLPDENGQRRFRIRPANSVVFNLSETGEVVSVSRYRNDKLRETLPRVEDENRITMDGIYKLRQREQRLKAFQALGMYRLSGTLSFTHAGVSGEVQFLADGSENYLFSWDLDSFGNNQTGVTSQYGATKSSHSPFEEHTGRYLEQVQKGHQGLNYLDWRDLFEKAEVLGNDELDGKQVHVVKLSGGNTPATILFLDPENGDILKQKVTMLHPLMGQFEATLSFGDYRLHHGLRIPFEVRSRNQHVGELVFRYNKIETNLDLNPKIFTIKDSAK